MPTLLLSTKEQMDKPEIIDINYVGSSGKCYLVKYKGFSNVMLKEEITDWCKEVDDLNLSKDK